MEVLLPFTFMAGNDKKTGQREALTIVKIGKAKAAFVEEFTSEGVCLMTHLKISFPLLLHDKA